MPHLVQAHLNVSSPFSTRVPMTRTNYAVDAATGAGSSGRNAICDASRSTVITPHYSTRARKANAKYIAPIAMSARRYYAVLPECSARPRRTRSPVQSILNLDFQSNPSRCRISRVNSLFQTSKVDSPVFVDSPVVAPDCRFPRRRLLEDSCCATPRCRRGS